ncbi:MAG: hypothetical protein JRI25_26940, partial [Deltaproteobacteria bacterium]|nr:hypothetical protein [Deltaproteobacteria bacterium]
MSQHANPDGGTQAPTSSLHSEVLDRIARLTDSVAPAELRSRVADAVHALDDPQLAAVHRALEEVVDLEDRTVRDVLGRDGKVVAVHHFRACRAEDPEASWDYRPPSAPIRALRDALMRSLLGTEGMQVDGVQRLEEAVKADKRFLFISNHESVFDLAVLAQ